MQRHRRWSAEVLETLPKSVPVRLQVSVWSDGSHELRWPDDLGHCNDAAVEVRSLAGLLGVASIAIYQSERYCYDDVEGYREGMICAQWNEEAGWQGGTRVENGGCMRW